MAHCQTRATLLSEPTHRIVVHSTPKHALWPTQLEIWLRILARKLLKRGSFVALEELKHTVLACIEDHSPARVKPFK
jgi:hypothetical protein